VKIEHNMVVKCVRGGGGQSEWKNWGTALYVVKLTKEKGHCFLEKCESKFKKNFKIKSCRSYNLKVKTVEKFITEGSFIVEEKLSADYKIFLELEKL